ncbi:hypothetical protein GJV06_16910 [Enterobacteriaceae bacterium RIT691]|nr:hypothetical protein [Enterobacteriaceae bacterium RIT691]
MTLNRTKHINGKAITLFGFNMKKKGKNRTLYKAIDESALVYKKMATVIYEHYLSILDNPISSNENNALSRAIKDIPHAFFKGRSPITNAQAHIGFDLTITIDIKDFFGSITDSMLASHFSSDVLDACFIDGTLPQGLATSPVISNIAMIGMDQKIYTYLSQYTSVIHQESSLRTLLNQISKTHNENEAEKNTFAYTRYADDISISINLRKDADARTQSTAIIKSISALLAESGFKVNTKKTKVMLDTGGYRIITGVAVNKHKIKATRKTIRLIRASMHNANLCKAEGLLNWADQIKRAM